MKRKPAAETWRAFFVARPDRMPGLRVAQKIIELHAGTFLSHSAEGAGTTIIMALPKK
jgi:light-regulated signal transduction histidine kinase (bacteriophytochrome)